MRNYSIPGVYMSEKGAEKAAIKAENFDFEEAIQTLESLVESLEEGNMSLEESLKAFEKGIKLTRECQSALEQAEQKVKILVSDGDEPVVEDLDAG